MRPVTTATVASVAICAIFWNVENRVLVSAFSINSQNSGNRASDKSTERSYGEYADVDILVPTSPLQGLSSSATIFPTRPSSSSSSSQPDERLIVNSQTTSKQRLHRQHDRMVRPKSLHSSSSKIVAPKKNQFPDLLTKDEEIQLTRCIRSMRSAVRVRDDLVASHPNPHDSDFPWQPSETEWAVACGLTVTGLRRVMQEGQEARTKLVAANGGLVHSIAKKYHYSLKQASQGGGGVGTILTLQDMVQEGNLGLMEAAERFDPERGFRFSTYATWWVRQRILRSISDNSRVIRLPGHVQSMLSKINKARKQMEKEIGRPPSNPELAHYMELSVDKLQMYTDSSRSVLSLELPVSPQNNFKGEDRRTLGDKIASDSPTPVENAEVESLRRDIRDVVNELAARERDVLVVRFGLDDGTPRTVAETSKRLGISRDRVRYVEARALNKLRHPQRNYKLKEYVGGEHAEEEEHHVEEINGVLPERIWSF